MGYHVKAEYTLELLRTAKAYDHIVQRHLCTGFLLTAEYDEYAIRTLLEKWQEIDSVTSDRVRFLFFFGRDTVLSGYPYPPHFTQYGYIKHNRPLVDIASSSGFNTKVSLEHQSALDRPRPHLAFDGVRRLAEELGVTRFLPCLVWARHDQPHALYVRRVEGMPPVTLFNLIRSFCDSFYDANCDILSRMIKLELQIEQQCGALELTATDLIHLELDLDEYDEACSTVILLKQLSIRETDTWEYLPRLVEAANRAAISAILHLESDSLALVRDVSVWAKSCIATHNVFASLNTQAVPHLATAFSAAREILTRLPSNVPRFLPPHTPAFEHHLLEFLHLPHPQRTDTTENRRSLTERWVKCHRYISTRLESMTATALAAELFEVNYVCLFNMSMLLRERRSRCDSAEVAALSDAVDTVIRTHLDRLSHCTAVNVHLWLFADLSQRLRALEVQFASRFHSAAFIHTERKAWLQNVQAIYSEIESLCGEFKWPNLADYELIKLAGSPAGKFSYTSKDNLAPVHQLDEDVAIRLIPIAQFMNERQNKAGGDVRAFEELHALYPERWTEVSIPPSPQTQSSDGADGLVSHDTLLQLHEAAIQTGLANCRGTLLCGIDRSIAAKFQSAPDPASQLLTDLDEMNRIKRLRGGSVPLVNWIKNALTLAGPKAESEMFHRVLGMLQTR